MRWFTDWEEIGDGSGCMHQVRRNELGLTEEQDAEQMEMLREALDEEYGEDGP